MNGVRRLLNGGGPSTTTPPPPLQPLPPVSAPPPRLSSKSSRPSQDSPSASPTNSKPTAGTPGLVIRKERARLVASPTDDRTLGNSSVQPPGSTSTPASARSPAGSVSSLHVASPTRRLVPNGAGTAFGSPTPSLSRVPPPSLSQPVVSESSVGWKRSSGLVNVRDELLMSLLTSEAVVDSRECKILSAEEVEELKKEYHVLKIRQTAMGRKVELETKIRDAALLLSKVNAAHRKVSKQTEEQLEAAERRVVTARQELWRASERASEAYQKLLEHRTGVLGYSVHQMEKSIHSSSTRVSEPDASRAITPNRNSTISVPSAPSKFDGAHLFAGHTNAQIPKAPFSASDIATLEVNLRAATESLNAANKKNAELARELTHLRLEKEQIETMMSMELQSAEETVAALEQELPRFEEIQAHCDELAKERAQWEEDRQQLAVRAREVERLEGRLELLEEKSGEAAEMERMLASIRRKADADVQRKSEALSLLQVEYEEARAHWQAEKAVMEGEMDRLTGGGEARVELDGAIERLRMLMRLHDVDHTPRDTSLQGLLASFGTHLENVSAIMKEHVNSREEMESQLYAELEASRQEREEAKREALALDARVKELASSSGAGPPIEYKGDVAEVAALLQSVWALLPVPGGAYSKSGALSPSDMNIRSLKALYDPKSPQAGRFSLDAFVARVQAVVIDNRGLIERLVRFAQAHDLLKKNAERAQRLAEDSNAALETYQKQVATLDDQNYVLQQKQAGLMDEIEELQAAVGRAVTEKRELETHAAEQAETVRQLTEANNALSAKTLTLAQEAASAPEMVRKQLEGQLAECQKALDEAREEVDGMRTSEQTQRVALLDELNSMQTENGNLRAQLRALKK